jgi:hypothetical protein
MIKAFLSIIEYDSFYVIDQFVFNFDFLKIVKIVLSSYIFQVNLEFYLFFKTIAYHFVYFSYIFLQLQIFHLPKVCLRFPRKYT